MTRMLTRTIFALSLCLVASAVAQAAGLDATLKSALAGTQTPAVTALVMRGGKIVAAAAAEHATGQSYETLMRHELFAPLGMMSVGFGITGAGQPQGHRGGKLATLADANPPMFAPAGNLHLSMADWAKFCLDQMDGYHGGGKILKPQTYRMMETRLPDADTGLAWGVQDSVAGFAGPVLTHAGSDGNWYALVALFPQTQSGVLVAANAGEDMGGDKAAKAVFKALLPEVADPVPAK